ncbi:uncharacterized protein EV420DRAFT_1492625 [Desarmillaria tabescens]|uniref:Cns1/TTC4 wheel domain-containing protein n=1 Tax=Armillaria tabescens TaxID=1929756 RepID=A0AA39NNW0_ARMTA|nr:uncharacterized protein EV420DRAFT_1492625 [Desarmillaria tabescens]KAK0469117.1 hypothetical protein EV420DRAFT_1492625 [Desarmillaria tabescens]
MTSVEELKERANNAHRRKSYRQAIQLYSQALDSITTVEIKRQILSSRSQVYLDFGDLYAARRDNELALSSDYTTPDSPKALTATCCSQQAKIMYKFSRYNEAQTCLEQCESLKKSVSASRLSDTEIQLLIDIDVALSRPEDRDERRKDELLRALDYRGAIVEEDHRGTFPHHPDPYIAAMEDPSDLFEFDTDDGRPYQNLRNPDVTPLCVPLKLVLPEFHHNPFRPGETCVVKTRVTEDTDMYEAVDGTLSTYFSHMLHHHEPASLSHAELVALQSRHMIFVGAVAIIITREGRFLEIPPSATVQDIWKGGKLPRKTPCPFRDLRPVPKVLSPDQIDGISVSSQRSIDILVFPGPKDELTHKLRVFAEQIDRMREIMEIEMAART